MPGRGAAADDRGVPEAAGLVGASRLAALVDSLPVVTTASWMGTRPQGLLVYAADGYMAAQIMNPDRSHFAGHAASAPDAAVRAA